MSTVAKTLTWIGRETYRPGDVLPEGPEADNLVRKGHAERKAAKPKAKAAEKV